MEISTLNSQNSNLKVSMFESDDNANTLESRDLQRYYALLNRHLLETTWTESEANLICEALKEYRLEKDPEQARTIWKQVINAFDRDGLNQKWQINRETFYPKIQALTHFEAVALVDAVERYWTRAELYPQESLTTRLMRVDLIKCCDFAL